MPFDPISAITAVLGLFKAITGLKDLHDQYKNAPKEVKEILDECDNIENKLKLAREVMERIHETVDQLENRDAAMSLFHRSIDEITITLEEIQAELPEVQARRRSKLGFWENARFVWDSDYFKTQLSKVQRYDTHLQDTINMISGLHTNRGIESLAQPTWAEVAKGPVACSELEQDLSSELARAWRKKDLSEVTFLLDTGASPNMKLQSGRYLLHSAVEDKSSFGYEAAQTLLEHSAAVDVKNQQGQTPLFRAVLRGSTQAVALLLDHGADPMARAPNQSARSLAAEGGKIRILQLLYNKIEPRTTENMYYPFLNSLRHRQFQSASFFLGLGFSIDRDSMSGILALHDLAGVGNLEAIKWLMSQGADKSLPAISTGGHESFTTPGNYGTAEDIARSRRHEKVARYLASHQE